MAVSKVIELFFRTKGAEKASKATKKVDSSLMALGKTAIGVGAALYAVRGTIRGLGAIVNISGKASQIDVMTTAFLNMGKQLNFNENSLEKLRVATNNTVEDIELLEMANNALLLGIVNSDDEMANLFDSAQRLARAVGKDARFGVESLVTGMGRQSKLMLDNIGIIIKTEDAYKAYAETLEKSVKDLTDAEKKQAFLAATMESAESKVKKLGEEQLTVADTAKQLETAYLDLQLALAEKVEPQVETILNLLKRGVEGITNFVQELGAEEPSTFAEGMALLAEKTKDAEKSYQDIAKSHIAFTQAIKEFDESGKGRPALKRSAEEIMTLAERMKDLKEVTKVSVPVIHEFQQSWLSAEQQMGIDLTQDLARNLASAVIHGQNLGEALTSSLKAIAIEMAANAAIFALLSSFTGGAGGAFATTTAAAPGGVMGFLLQGFTGKTPTVTNNVNINGGLISDSYVRNTLAPALSRVKSYS